MAVHKNGFMIRLGLQCSLICCWSFSKNIRESVTFHQSKLIQHERHKCHLVYINKLQPAKKIWTHATSLFNQIFWILTDVQKLDFLPQLYRFLNSVSTVLPIELLYEGNEAVSATLVGRLTCLPLTRRPPLLSKNV